MSIVATSMEKDLKEMMAKRDAMADFLADDDNDIEERAEMAQDMMENDQLIDQFSMELSEMASDDMEDWWED